MRGAPRAEAAEAGGAGEPLVLFVDDLQWADGASLDALGYACRSWSRDGVPLLLVMAAREEDVRKNDLGGWLSSLGRELTVRRLPLAPMDEENVLSLLRLVAGTTVPNDDEARREDLERAGRWLRKESDGHPLFLAQILDVLLERGVLVEHTGQDGAREIVLSGEGFDEGALRGLIPGGLRELILDKLGPLSADAKDVLAAGAVLGRGFGFGELARVAEVGEAEGIAALDELVSARLLEEGGTPSGRAYSFAHDKIRDVVYTEAGEARRGVFHRRALEALEDRGASAAELARHAVAAKLREKALHYLLGAAEEAMDVLAAGDAVGHFERARDLLEDPPRETAASDNVVGERLRLYGGLARARALIHDRAGSQRAYEKLLAVAVETGDRETEWEALYGLGKLASGFTFGPDAVELVRGVRRREGPEGRPGPAGGAENEPGPVRLAASITPRVALGYARKALRLARELDRVDLVLRSEFGLGIACAWAGLYRETAAHMESALSFYAASDNGAAEASDVVHLVGSRAHVAFCKAMVEGAAGAFGPDGPLHKLARETTELWGSLDNDYARGQLGSSAMGLVIMGEYEDAIGNASRGLEASRSLGKPQFAFMSLDGLGDAYRETFALEGSRSAYTEMFDWISGPVLGGHVHARLCAVAALEGEWGRAHEHALEAIGAGKELFLPLSYLHRHHDIEALLRGGDAELARESLRSFARRVGRGRGHFRVAYLRSAAVFARWNGDSDGALSHLREALELAERLELPGEIWQVGGALGEAHEERGETGPSERAFGRAAVVVRRLSSKIPEGDLRERFLAAPRVRRVLEKGRE